MLLGLNYDFKLIFVRIYELAHHHQGLQGIHCYHDCIKLCDFATMSPCFYRPNGFTAKVARQPGSQVAWQARSVAWYLGSELGGSPAAGEAASAAGNYAASELSERASSSIPGISWIS